MDKKDKLLVEILCFVLLVLSMLLVKYDIKKLKNDLELKDYAIVELHKDIEELKATIEND